MRKAVFAAAVLVLLAACGVEFNTGPGAHNDAEKALEPIVAALAQVHPSTLCVNGDNGRGLDNKVPWFRRHLLVQQPPNLDQLVAAAAAKNGFDLQRDAATQSPRGYPATDYVATNGERTLRVRITPATDEALQCVSGWPGGSPPPDLGRKAIVILYIELPEV